MFKQYYAPPKKKGKKFYHYGLEMSKRCGPTEKEKKPGV